MATHALTLRGKFKMDYIFTKTTAHIGKGRRTQIFFAIAAFILFLFFLKNAFLPSLTTGFSDFSNYFIPAKIFHDNGDTSKTYDIIEFQHIMSQYGVDSDLGSPWFFPPFSTAMFLPFSNLDVKGAKTGWNILNLLALLALIYLVSKWTAFNIIPIAVLVFLSGIPLKNNFLLGHFYLLELFLILLAFTCYRKGLKILPGVIIAFCAAVKISPIILLSYFLIKKEWKVTAAILLSFLLFLFLGFVYLGKDANLYYMFHIFPRISKEMFPVPFDVLNQSVFTILQKLFLYSETLNPQPLFEQPVVYVILKNFVRIFPLFITLGLILKTGKDFHDENIRLEMSLFILTILFLWGCTTYHFTLLILPVILLLDFLWKRKKRMKAILVFGLYLICGTHLLDLFYHLPEGFLSPFKYMRIWLLVSIFIVAISCYMEQNNISFKNIFLKVLGATCIAAAILSAPYLYGLNKASYDSAALAFSENPLLSYGPSVQNDVLACYGIEHYSKCRYILFSSNHVFSTREREFNVFDPDLSPNGREIIFEVLKEGRSQIGKLDQANVLDLMTPREQNCRYPTYHPNGKQFVYSCKNKGGMDIFIQEIPGALSPASTVNKFLTDSPCNEIEPHFSPDGNRVVYCSDKNGIFNLYCLDLKTLQEEQLTFENVEDRRPRWSPDGKWIVFYSFRNGNRDIWVIDPESKAQIRITKNPANDRDPDWDTDSKLIYFCSDRGRGIFCPAVYKIPFVKKTVTSQ